MDASSIAMIASAAVSLLVPYLKSLGEGIAKKAGEEIGKKTGETAWRKTQHLYETIKTKFMTKSDTSKIINALAKSPEDTDTQSATRFHLKEVMTSDEYFAKELATILKEASDAGADTIFHTTIYGNVQKLVQMGNVFGDVKI